MKHTLEKKSWHFWLAKKFGDLNYWEGDEVDICTYVRKVIRGVIGLAFYTIILTLITIAYFIGGYEFIVWLFTANGPEEPPFICIPFLIITGSIILLLALGLCMVGQEKYAEYRKAHHIERKPSFITLAYRKWKEKTCFFVNFK